MPTYNLKINGKSQTVEVAADTPLLWVLRDHLEHQHSVASSGLTTYPAITPTTASTMASRYSLAKRMTTLKCVDLSGKTGFSN